MPELPEVEVVRRGLEAHAVGDLDGLVARLDEFAPQLAAAQEARKTERAQQNEQIKHIKYMLIAVISLLIFLLLAVLVK